ncbi:hypothetical protein FRB95_011895 [Tulasnella sp. JGI-2019a]|nr:hypothetical protein FRB95_011895 [Tulasnella sp. JGI-2019a]
MDPIPRGHLRPNGSLGIPVELLRAILQYTLTGIWCKDLLWGQRTMNSATYYDKLCLIRGVCIRWKEVIDASPIMWALVGTTTPNIEKCLAKSKNVPLTIELRGKPNSDKALANWERSMGIISRWGIADIECPLEGDIKERCVSSLEASPAPMLRGLPFKNHAHSNIAERIDLFHGIAPRLQELVLHQVSPKNWGSPFLFNLRMLVLTKVQGPTMEQLLTILETCTGMERLSLLFVRIDDKTSASEPRRMVDLPNLDYLMIRGLSHASTYRLLRTIQAPSCRDFLIQPPRGQGPTDITICSRCINISFRSFLTTTADVRVLVSTQLPGQVHVTATGENNHRTFNAQLQGYSSRSIWSVFVPLLFPETSPILIELAFASHDLDALLGTNAWMLHGVWKLNLGFGMERAVVLRPNRVTLESGMERVIQELAFTKMVGGEFRSLWPTLCELSVSDVSGEELLWMLEARAKAATAEHLLGDYQQIPALFKHLVLGSSCMVSPKILEDI